ncbi:MAG: putative signal transducing protein [Sphingomonas oligoaromativorans]|uniref:putative signal transducing protein n=1 Tax=Sphingomonas oligoaromativorans TaxID=575322 RepID=UPI0014224BBF|nr:DUF2007 domain-containing protein [Sphingomonas oligoaromativorans]NIJ34512.1 hypothetical protein [Sphingomonas oligoaromativorans]
MALVEIETFPEHAVAEMARGMLAAEGIQAVLFDSGLASLGFGGLTPVRLMVDESDRATAERLLADISA